MLLFAGNAADAALISRAGGQAYYDTVIDITWFADANYALTSGYTDVSGEMSWDEAQGWISSLNTANHLGVSDWRLPRTLQPDATCSSQVNPGGPFPVQSSGSNCTGSEMGHLSAVDNIGYADNGVFSNIQSVRYWSGTEYAPDNASAWAFSFFLGTQGAYSKGLHYYA